MNLDGTYRIAAPQERVWDEFLDPEALKAAIPGCQKLEPLGNGRYVATLAIGIAAIKGTYTGNVAVVNQEAPSRYDLEVEGSGRPGFVKGVGHISLAPDGDAATVVTVHGEAQVGGPVLSVGSRLVVPAAKLLMNQFFTAMQRRVEGPPSDTSASS